MSLETHMCDYEFLITLMVWYDILFHGNLVSKSMQKVDMDLPTAVMYLENCKQFLIRYRESGYTECVLKAREICEELEIETQFKKLRPRQKKRLFLYEHEDETRLDPEHRYKTTVFDPLLNTAISFITEQFTQLQTHSDKWSFLYNMQKVSDSRAILLKQCNTLSDILKAGDDLDIDGEQLCQFALQKARRDQFL
ncbi:hypothetical protein NQ314_007531 [Rhamnusium bicolor]|uniref:Uncharacterized protein n=1 Tax=Rhamnusium bicolor TaxID=1586634 RepID=A0AAV8YKV6_9CUCU|nr:hypothetical protein NQ314_007531 [Rhamnusium bicolor]